jgi:hypothetical protein
VTFADIVAMGDEPYRAQKEAVIGRTFQPGLVIPIAVFTGHLDTHWLVSDDDDDGTVNVSAVGSMDYPPFACLVNHKGEVVTYNPSPATSPELAEAVPDDGVWYSVVVRAAWVTRGRGRLTLASGSAAVVGSGTAFARMVAQDDIPVPPLLNQPTKIRIASGGSNDGDYRSGGTGMSSWATMRAKAVPDPTTAAEPLASVSRPRPRVTHAARTTTLYQTPSSGTASASSGDVAGLGLYVTTSPLWLTRQANGG